MCGEKFTSCYGWAMPWGSPPHVRGKVSLQCIGGKTVGITPACAGKRSPLLPSHGAVRDHPRMCGEKRQFRRAVQCCRGSPPHVRGKGSRRYGSQWSAGITPACAGKRPISSIRWCGSWDHPRMCGEKKLKAGDFTKDTGSPPHVRGKGLEKKRGADIGGITPACAGKSGFVGSSLCGGEDHPRMCGEKIRKER